MQLPMRLLSFSFRRLIRRGSLTVIDATGSTHLFAGSETSRDFPSVTFRLHNPGLAWKLALNPELYLGEAYMDGSLTIEDGDLYDLMTLGMINMGWGHGHGGYNALARLRSLWRRLSQFNPVGRAQRNAAHHYDLSNALYESFLDEDMQYSCGYFLHANDSLETAQRQKQAHIAAKLCLRPGQRVLDIGCGWGGMARYLNDRHGAQVTGITLSEKQLAFARAQHGAGERGWITFRLEDYRETKIEDGGAFDRIVSVGMFEHVGAPHFQTFFRRIGELLADDGVALIHTIGRAGPPATSNQWIDKYIFPGAYVPALSEILTHIERAGLYVTDIEILRLHYAETLKAWRRRFTANREKVRELYDERFCRMWEFYLAGAEASFRHGGQVVYQLQLAKRQEAVPLTRDYLLDMEREALARPDVAA